MGRQRRACSYRSSSIRRSAGDASADRALYNEVETSTTTGLAAGHHTTNVESERRFNARVGIADGDPASMAKAMGQALDDAAAQVAAVSLSVQRHRASFPR